MTGPAACTADGALFSFSYPLLSPQYDLAATTYSPDGKVFQTEYAQKAVDNTGYGFCAVLCWPSQPHMVDYGLWVWVASG